MLFVISNIQTLYKKGKKISLERKFLAKIKEIIITYFNFSRLGRMLKLCLENQKSKPGKTTVSSPIKSTH